MGQVGWLALYSGLILVVSLFGGSVPLMGRVTHSRLQLYLSLSAGVMLGASSGTQFPKATVTTRARAAGDACPNRLQQGLQSGRGGAVVWLLGDFLHRLGIHDLSVAVQDEGAAGQNLQLVNPRTDRAAQKLVHGVEWCGQFSFFLLKKTGAPSTCRHR